MRTLLLWLLSRVWGMILDDAGNTVPRSRMIRRASAKAWRLALVLGVCQGCTFLTASVQHTSHPLAGYPVSPATDEDSLDLAKLCAGSEYRQGHRLLWYVEQCLGYKLRNGGFVGPSLTYQAEAGVKVYLGRR
jgi:hypothetical protein